MQKNSVKIKAKKSLGQNFLIDKNILSKITKQIDLKPETEIVEIGPGSGNLTEFLIKLEPKKLYVIEKDEKLSDDLIKKFNNKIQIIKNDILKFSNNKIFSNETIVIGNLPYNISSQILVKFILNENNFKFSKLIFMFQKEMADRIIAKVNSKNYGRLSILTNWKFDIKKNFDIKPNSFMPKPKVDSTLISFKKKETFQNFKNPKSLEYITSIFFNQRRKKIKKPINQIFKNNLLVIKDLDLDYNLRPQNIDIETYCKLAAKYEKLIY